MQRYLTEADRANQDAQAIRARIAKGIGILNLADLTPEERMAAEERMASLREALRATELTQALSAGLVMAWATVGSLSTLARKDQFEVPEGSLFRVYIPGACDVTVTMNDMGEEV